MKPKYFIPILLTCFFVSTGIKAQMVMGFVYEQTENKLIPIEGANVYFPGTNVATSSDSEGMWMFEKPNAAATKIVISFVGFRNDTVNAEGMDIKTILKKSINLDSVNVTATNFGTNISLININKTELINNGELKKNACCNLSESFESNPTVDVSFSDAVTGAKQIQLLGLSGTYVQLLTDVLPTVRGLNINSGLTYIPGAWVDMINLNKGTGSVANGYESITGQIDVELKKPQEADPFYFGYYLNSDGKTEVNAQFDRKFKKFASTLTMLNFSNNDKTIDENNDRFLDLPTGNTVNLLNRWHFNLNKNMEMMAGFKFLTDNKNGGTLPSYNQYHDYVFNSSIYRAEFFLKTSYTSLSKPYQSLGIQINSITHYQENNFQFKQFSANENSFYLNLIYQSIFKNSRNKWRAGFSFLNDQKVDSYLGNTNVVGEEIPGAFFEYTYNNLKNISFIAGVRADKNNLYGMIYTPRLHTRFDLGKKFILRTSAGSGFRTANVLAENISLMASSRQFVFVEEIKPERAWNYGINLTKEFTLFKHLQTFSMDVYRTDFINQVIVDEYTDAHKIFIYNMNGKSFANSFQAQLSSEIIKNLTLLVAFKYNEVMQQTSDGKMEEKILSPRDRALFNAAYETKKHHWKFDFTTQWIGKQHLPNTQNNPIAFQMPAYSPAYFRLLGQITFIYKDLEVYVGSENLTNYTQINRIIDAANPDSYYFDSSMIWGPVTGRMFYTGIRFTVK